VSRQVPRKIGIHGRVAPAFIGIAMVTALLAGCGPSSVASRATPSGGLPSAATASASPDWYAVELIDVRTGASFSMNELSGSVVLIEAMAIWCPTCLEQQAEVKALHELLGESSGLVSVSLDVDLHEDAPTLKEYATENGLDWYVAVAPLEVARALGNLYSAQYLNPPLSPMLLIDRDGTAVQLPYGVKTAEVLRDILEPYLQG
jgi:thiol-disulfide isomerase/thioredoxin